MKKLFIMFLFGMFCAGTVQAQLNGTVGTITWAFTGNELTISGTGEIPNSFFFSTTFDIINKGDVESVVIMDGITGISDFVFVSTNITSVTIPASVTSIDINSFKLCEGLTSITVNVSNPVYYSEEGVLFDRNVFSLFTYPAGKTGTYTVPDEVKIIGENAFWGCHKLTSVIIPQSVISIEDFAFSESNIGSVTINGTGLITIGESTFDMCIDLTSVNIPTSVTHIGDFAFWGCEQLTSISIPASVTQIGIGAFTDCGEMTSILVDEGNTKYASVDGALFDNTKTTLITFPGGKSGKYVIPESVESIENTAFYNCKKMTSVTIPASVTNIGNYAFARCGNLSLVVNLSLNPQVIPDKTFDETELSGCTLRVPNVALYQNDPAWNLFGNIVPLEVAIKLDMNEICLLTGATATLTATILGDVISPDIIVWESSQPTVATVNTGIISALMKGITAITASVYDNVVTCMVTVIQPGTSTIGGTVDNPGSGNIRVNLYVNTNTGQTKGRIIGGYVLLATTIPNDNGEYRFENLPEGSYQIEVVIDDYEPEATDELPLSEDETLADIDFIVDEEDGKIIVVADIPTGTEEISEVSANVLIYPNPFTDAVRIMGAEAETGHALSVQVINTAGAIVHIQTINSPEEVIRLEHLPAGMYFVRLGNGKMAKTVKVIKIQ